MPSAFVVSLASPFAKSVSERGLFLVPSHACVLYEKVALIHETT